MLSMIKLFSFMTTIILKQLYKDKNVHIYTYTRIAMNSTIDKKGKDYKTGKYTKFLIASMIKFMWAALVSL